MPSASREAFVSSPQSKMNDKQKELFDLGMKVLDGNYAPPLL